MVPHKQVSFATIIALSTLETLLIKLIKFIRILLKGKCIHAKIMPFWLPENLMLEDFRVNVLNESRDCFKYRDEIRL